jgi:hypothetical protein
MVGAVSRRINDAKSVLEKIDALYFKPDNSATRGNVII